MPFLEVTQDAGRKFFSQNLQGPVVMLNLLRFREVADCSASPTLEPAAPVSGAASYQLYIDHTLPFLREAGGDLVFYGQGVTWLIGPGDERWDIAMLVRHASVSAFLAFATDERYLGGAGHRLAAIADPRLLPLIQEA
ncbi:MAG: DUF1330 domain-containing protein [Gemmatimonadaceae bacterium]